MINGTIFFTFPFLRYVSINKHYMQWINDPVVTLLNGKVLDAGTSDVTVALPTAGLGALFAKPV